jgi:hypothetical protein
VLLGEGPRAIKQGLKCLRTSGGLWETLGKKLAEGPSSELRLRDAELPGLLLEDLVLTFSNVELLPYHRLYTSYTSLLL